MDIVKIKGNLTSLDFIFLKVGEMPLQANHFNFKGDLADILFEYQYWNLVVNYKNSDYMFITYSKIMDNCHDLESFIKYILLSIKYGKHLRKGSTDFS